MAERQKKASWRACRLYRNRERPRSLGEESGESFLGRGHRSKDPKMRGIPVREGWELRAEAGREVLSREGPHQVGMLGHSGDGMEHKCIVIRVSIKKTKQNKNSIVGVVTSLAHLKKGTWPLLPLYLLLPNPGFYSKLLSSESLCL